MDDELDLGLDDAAETTAAFTRELRELGGALAGAEVQTGALSRNLSRSLGRAMEGVIFDGTRASDALRQVATSLVDTVYAQATKPVTDHIGGLVSQGVGALTGAITPFAKGGVVSGPVTFPMAGGAGLMGEAGPEAIMPLTRGADGTLGVRSSGGGSTVVMNIQTPDAQSFQRSRSQIAAQMSRALGAGARNR